MAREYDIQSASSHCGACRRELAGGEEFTAALFDSAEGFARQDICQQCADAAGEKLREAFSVWTARVPVPEEPTKQFVDNQVLVGFFEKLAERDEPVKINFRFVLALMLMRKKILVHDGTRRDDEGREIWSMHYRKEGGAVEVVHPEMDAQEIVDGTAELGSIFEVET